MKRRENMSATAPESTRSPEGPQRPKISACVISFNEERNIRACLESLSWCDEIVVVDSYSQDKTATIAEKFGARVLRHEWEGHVAQKNHALDAATGEWVLALDCDERVTPRLRDRILEELENPDVTRRVDGFYISRKLRYLGRWLGHGGWFPEWRLRLFKRERGRWSGVDPHDTVELEGHSARLEPGAGGAGAGSATGSAASAQSTELGSDAAVILHYSFRDLSHQIKVLDRYTGIQAGELDRRGRRVTVLDVTLRPAWRFLWTYVLRGGFLDGAAGFHMAVNHAYAAYMKYARLWEICRGLVEPPAKSDLVPRLEKTATETEKSDAEE
jgi:hypothetical protein